jgi:hypothetical protein
MHETYSDISYKDSFSSTLITDTMVMNPVKYLVTGYNLQQNSISPDSGETNSVLFLSSHPLKILMLCAAHSMFILTLQGPTGYPGLKGEKGNMGVGYEGQKGQKGEKGDRGPVGSPASFSFTGPEDFTVGPIGDKGDKGERVRV